MAIILHNGATVDAGDAADIVIELRKELSLLQEKYTDSKQQLLFKRGIIENLNDEITRYRAVMEQAVEALELAKESCDSTSTKYDRTLTALREVLKEEDK